MKFINVEKVYISPINRERFDSTIALQDSIVNAIGKKIDNCDVTLTPKQKINIMKMIKENHETLVELLSVYIMHPERQAINILDHDISEDL